MKGLAVCPLSGKRIQDNKLVGDPITLEQGRKMFDQIGKVIESLLDKTEIL